MRVQLFNFECFDICCLDVVEFSSTSWRSRNTTEHLTTSSFLMDSIVTRFLWNSVSERSHLMKIARLVGRVSISLLHLSCSQGYLLRRASSHIFDFFLFRLLLVFRLVL